MESSDSNESERDEEQTQSGQSEGHKCFHKVSVTK